MVLQRDRLWQLKVTEEKPKAPTWPYISLPREAQSHCHGLTKAEEPPPPTQAPSTLPSSALRPQHFAVDPKSVSAHQPTQMRGCLLPRSTNRKRHEQQSQITHHQRQRRAGLFRQIAGERIPFNTALTHWLHSPLLDCLSLTSFPKTPTSLIINLCKLRKQDLA